LTDQRFGTYASGLGLRIDLNGTLFKIKSTGSKEMMLDSSELRDADLSNIKLSIDRDALLDKYSFVWDYAPKMWLNERRKPTKVLPEGWFPSTLEFFFDRTMGEVTDEGYMRLTTQTPLEKPYSRLNWFNGQQPDEEGLGAPCQTLIYPTGFTDSDDPVEWLLNPESSSVAVLYQYFMPYDLVKYGLGDHVGDIEHTTVYFTNGEPTIIEAHQHNWFVQKPWGDPIVEMDGTHPVLYNAQGTHATYYTAGPQKLGPGVYDLTAPKVMWDLGQNLDVIFPFDWVSPERTIKQEGGNLDGINYLTQVQKWGNKEAGFNIFGTYQRNSGPNGFLDKNTELMKALTVRGLTCEGVDTDRCIWPAGVFS